MATSGNTRDVDLAIGVSTTGVDGVARLRKEVNDLAASGDAASPEFAKLATELDKIAAQRAAVETFAELRRESASTAIALQAAAAEVDRLGAALPAARDDAARFAEAQADGKTALASTRAELQATRTALLELRKEYPVGKRDSDAYRDSVGALQQKLGELRVTQNEQRTALTAINASTREFAAVEREVVGSYNQAIASATALSNSYGEQNRALAVARDALRSVGLESTNLVEAQRTITASFERTRAAIQAEADAMAAGRVREAQATRDLVEANQLLASSFDFEKTTRVVAIEAQIAAARTKLASESKELVSTERALDAARTAGDLPQIASLETQLAATRTASESSTRRLAAANAALVAELQSTAAAQTKSVDAERNHAAALVATNAAIDASVARTAAQAASTLEVTAARERNANATRDLAELEQRLSSARTVGDLGQVVTLERSVAAAREGAEAATLRLATAETGRADRVRETAASEAQAAESSRAHAAALEAAASGVQRASALERELSAARQRQIADAQDEAFAERALTAARERGVDLVPRELNLAAAREASQQSLVRTLALQRELAAEVSALASSQTIATTVEREHADQLVRSAAAIETLVARSRESVAVDDSIAAAREKVERALLAEASAEKALATARQTGVDLAPRELNYADALQATARAIQGLDAAQTELAQQRNAVDTAALVENERRLGDALRATATAIEASIVSARTQVDLTREVTTARESNAAATRELAALEAQLANARTSGDLTQIVTLERSVSAARASAEESTRQLAAAEAVRQDRVRETAAAEAQAAASTRAHADALEASIVGVQRAVALERELGLARLESTTDTRAEIAAQRALDEARQSGDVARVAAAERALADARESTQQSTLRAASAQGLLATELAALASSQTLATTSEREHADQLARTAAVLEANAASVVRSVIAERQVAAARQDAERATVAEAEAERALATARQGGVDVAPRELALAEARRTTATATSALAAAQAELVQQRSLVSTDEQIAAEKRLGDQLRATAAAIDASVSRSSEQAASIDTVTAARERSTVATRALYDEQRRLDFTALLDRKPLALDEDAVAQARTRSRVATADLADAEARLVTQIRDGIAIQRQQVDAARERSTVGAALVGRTNEEAVAEERLATVQARTVASTRELATVEQQLDAARRGGDQAQIAELETRAATARQALELATRDLTAAQQGFVEAIRASAAAQATALATTEQLAAAQRDLDAVLDVEKTIRQAAAETQLANKRADLTRFTNQLADAQKLLVADLTLGAFERQAQVQLDAAAAMQATERAARELAAAETLLNASLSTDRTLGQISAERALATARDSAAVAARGLADAEKLLDAEQTLGDRGRVAVAEDAVAAARQRNENATKDLGAAEQAYVAEIKGSIAATDQQISKDRERAAQALKTAQAIRDQGTAARASLEAAFSATGVRSAETIKLEIIAIGQALDKIARESKETGSSLERAFESGRARVAALNRELEGINRVKPSIEGVTKSTNLLSDALRQATVYFSAFTVGKEFIEANTQLETLRRTLTIVTGDAGTAAKQVDFLRKTALDSGVAVASISGAYSKFASSAVAAGIDLQTVNTTFANVTKAAGLLGLSSEEVGGALTALGQIASKGKVSMEELGQQLGDRLPAVLATTAKGLNLTTAELTKLIQNGQVLGDANFFRAFSSGIEQTFLKGQGQVEGLNASIARVRNSFNELFTRFGDAGAARGLADIFVGLANAIKAVGDPIIATGKVIGILTAASVDLARTASTLDFKIARAGLDRFREGIVLAAVEARKAAPDFAKYFDPFGVGAEKAAAQINTLVDAQRALKNEKADGPLPLLNYFNKVFELAGIASAGTAAYQNRVKELIVAQEVASGSSNRAAQAANDLGKGMSAASLAAGEASTQYLKLTSDYDGIIESVNKAGDALVKQAAAAKTAGDAANALSAVTGNEVEIRRQSVVSAQQYAASLAAVAQQRQIEADVQRAAIAAIEADARATGTLTEEKQKEIDKRKEKLVAVEAELAKSNELASAARIERDTAVLLRDTYGDQSAALKELQTDLGFYANKLAILQSQQARGVDVTTELADTTRQYVLAEARVKDALDDTTKALIIKNQQSQNASNLTIAQLNVDKASLETQLQIAQANGDTNRAIELQIQIKQVEIKIIEAKVAAMITEANGAIAVAKATEAQRIASGDLDPVKKQEIANSIANAQAKILEAKALGQNVEALQKQIDLLRSGAGQYQSHGNAAKGAGVNVRGFGTETRDANKSLDGIAGNLVTGIHLFEDYGAAAKKAAADLQQLGSIATEFKNSAQSVLGDKLKAGTLGKDDLALATLALQQAKDNAAAISSVHGATLQDIQQAGKVLGDAQRAFDAAKSASVPILTPQQIKDQEAARLASFKSQVSGAFNEAVSSSGVSPFKTTTINNTINTTSGNSLEISQATLEVQKAQIDAQLQLAKAQGDTVAQTNLEIQAKQIEIQQLQTKITLTNQSADATIAAANAKIFELASSNNLTAEQNKQLRDQINAAQAQKVETGVTAVQIETLQKQIAALQTAGPSVTITADTNAAVVSATTIVSDLDAALEAFGLQSQAELQAKADALTAAYKQVAASADVSIADQRTAFEQWAAAMIAANKGVEDAVVANARAVLATKELLNAPAPKPPTFTPTAAPAPYFSGSGTSGLATQVKDPNAATPIYSQPVSTTGVPRPVAGYTINLQLNGGSTTPVTVASEEDANSLLGFFSKLEQDARSSGSTNYSIGV